VISWAGAGVALGLAALAGATLVPLALAAAIWALAAVLPRLRLTFLTSAPLALALGLGTPRDGLDIMATFGAMVASLAPLLGHLGGAPTWRQVSAGSIVLAGVLGAALTPWGQILVHSDLAPGALTLTIAALTVFVYAVLQPRSSANTRAGLIGK